MFKKFTPKKPLPSPLNLSVDFDSLNTEEIEIDKSFHENTFHSNFKAHKNAICTICKFIIEEDLLELSCNHICHRDCFINNILTCKKCEDDAIEEDFLSPKALSPKNDKFTPKRDIDMIIDTPIMDAIDIPMTPSDQIIFDPLKVKQNKVERSDLRIQQNQLLSPRTSFNKNLNKDLFDSLMKPRVKFIEEFKHRKNVFDSYKDDKQFNLNYLLNIKPPKFLNSINVDKNLELKNAIYDEIKCDVLKNINWNDESIDFSNLGKLIIFEIIDISTNGNNWDQVRLLLFENSLLLIDLKGEILIGQIFIHNINNMVRFLSGIRLNLDNTTIPELQICSDIPLIISRLEYYFKKLLNHQFIQETSVYQLTINGWNIIKDNYHNLPVEILRFQNCIENNLEIPENLLIKSMPSPEIIPFNLIISITLLNNTNLSNEDYRVKILKFLDQIRSNLRPFDKISLIFVGLNGSGIPCRKGSFIGSIEPNWSGWDSIYNEVKIQGNHNHKNQQILRNGFDELSITLDKCKDLFPFLNSGNTINKLIIINSNIYEPEEQLVNQDNLNFIEGQFKTLLNNEKNLSVDFFRIGKEYTPELEFGLKTVLQPSLINNNDVLKIPYGSKILRFDDFDDFSNKFILILNESFKKIVLPNIQIDILKIIGTRDMVEFFKIEVHGKLIEINNFSNLKIIMNNIEVNDESNLMLKLKVDLSNLKFDNCLNHDTERFIELPLLSYMTNWFNESDDYKVLNTKIFQDKSTFSSFLDGSMTPPMNESLPNTLTPSASPINEQFFDSQLTVKTEKYYRKEIEIEIIKNLKLVQENQIMNYQSIFKNLINYILSCKTEMNFNSKFEHMELYQYKNNLNFENFVDYLLNKLYQLRETFEENETQALLACKDFTNWLV